MFNFLKHNVQNCRNPPSKKKEFTTHPLNFILDTKKAHVASFNLFEPFGWHFKLSFMQKPRNFSTTPDSKKNEKKTLKSLVFKMNNNLLNFNKVARNFVYSF